jgi:hypothetical protein
MINWNSIINNLKDGSDVTVDPSRWNLDNPEYNKILSMWKTANFNLNSIRWTNYYPGIHFLEDVIHQQVEHMSIKKVHRAWISKIDPGYMAPWHWDVEDQEEEFLKHGMINRYTVIIRQMAKGHTLIIGDDVFFNRPVDTVIKWAKHNEWHSSSNAGLEPSYLFHILGS